MSTSPALGFRQVLAIAPVRRLWIAQLVSVLGDFLAIFAVFSVATFKMHATAAQISLVLVAYMAPLAVAGPVAGVLVDRWNRRRTMIASDLIRSVLVLLLVFSTRLEHIYAIFIVLSVVSSFFYPAQSVTLRTLVPKEGLLSANALMSQAFQVTQIVSPAIAGMLVAWRGPDFCYYFDAVSFLFSAFMVSRIVVEQAPSQEPHSLVSVLSDLTTGLRFIFTHAAVSYVVLAMTVGMFSIRCFAALLAPYVRDVLSSGSAAFGLLNSLVGIGMIIGTQAIHRVGRGRPSKQLVVFGSVVAGASIAFLAAIGTTASTAAGLLGMGFGVAFIFIPTQTLLQEVTPTEMLGRVSSSLMSALAFIQVIAMALSASTVEAVGIRNLYFLSAAILVLMALAGSRKLASER